MNKFEAFDQKEKEILWLAFRLIYKYPDRSGLDQNEWESFLELREELIESQRIG